MTEILHLPKRESSTLVGRLRSDPNLDTLRRILPACLQSCEGTDLLHAAVSELLKNGELDPKISEIVEFLATLEPPVEADAPAADPPASQSAEHDAPDTLEKIKETASRVSSIVSDSLDLEASLYETRKQVMDLSGVRYFSCPFDLTAFYDPQNAHLNPELAIDEFITSLANNETAHTGAAPNHTTELDESPRLTRLFVPSSNYQHAIDVLNGVVRSLVDAITAIEIEDDDDDDETDAETRTLRRQVIVTALAKRVGFSIESEELNQLLAGESEDDASPAEDFEDDESRPEESEEGESDAVTLTLDDLALCAVCTYADSEVIHAYLLNIQKPETAEDAAPPAFLWLLLARAIGPDSKQDLSRAPSYLEEQYDDWPLWHLWRGTLPNLDAWRDILRWCVLDNELPEKEQWNELGRFCSENIEDYLWARQGTLTSLDLNALRDAGATAYGLAYGTPWLESQPLLDLTQCALPENFDYFSVVPNVEAICSLHGFIGRNGHDWSRTPWAWRERHLYILRLADAAWEQGLSRLSDAWLAYGLLSSIVLVDTFEMQERVDWRRYFFELAARRERSAHPMAARAVTIIEAAFIRWGKPFSAHAARGMQSLQWQRDDQVQKKPLPSSGRVILAWPSKSLMKPHRDRAEESLRSYPGTSSILEKLDPGIRELLVDEEVRFQLFGPHSSFEWKDQGFLMRTYPQIIERLCDRLTPEIEDKKDKTIGSFVHLLRASIDRLDHPQREVAKRLRSRIRPDSKLQKMLEELNYIRRDRISHSQVARDKHLKRVRELFFHEGLLIRMIESFPELSTPPATDT